MKTLLVTSALTFVPENYDGFILPMLRSPHVAGLIEIQNRELQFLTKGFALIVSAAAPKMGKQLISNWFSNSSSRREELCHELDKPFLKTNDMHSDETLGWIAQNQFDLILNARTRTIYRRKLLELPTFGCLNIHHGLLPDQRGLMCDFWSHLEELPAGFSIHLMTLKLDDGPILKVSEVKTDRKDYMESLRRGAEQEAIIAQDLLTEIARDGRVSEGTPNRSTKATYRRNPGIGDFYKMASKGIQR